MTRRRMWVILGLALGLVALATGQATAQSASAPGPLKGLFCNIDSTDFFWNTPIPEGQAGAMIDAYVDTIAGAGTAVLLCNTNSRRTNYRSQVWDAYWDGYDPNGPDDQPFLAPMAKGQVAGFRRGIANMLAVHQQGIDYPGRMIARARHDGMSPWITLRMNDCHYNDNPAHPFHGDFWKKNPQFARQNCPGYYATCLDYAHREVRDYFMALIDETLTRYDIDGLELDFMRECFLFSAGKEAEGAPILTAWMGDVRKRVAQAAVKRGHPIRLGVRVPSRPETALKWGLDAIRWAQEGLIDVLVVTPRWATLEFDMPLDQWRTLLDKSPVTLAGGLEILYRPWPGGKASAVTPELAWGAAAAVLSRGADAVYLFNYFPNSRPTGPQPAYQKLLQAMGSLDTLLQQPRTVGLTYRDITAPGEAYAAPLPAQGRELVFPMQVGPVPGKGWSCQLLLEFALTKDAPFTMPAVSVNSKPCDVVGDEAAQEGRRVVSVQVPLAHLLETGVQQIKVAGTEANAGAEYRVERVEVSFAPATK